jgi:hypothetical protein
MKKRAYLVVFVLVFVSLACSPLQNFFTSPGTRAPSGAPAETTGSLEAEATSAISVQLSWDAVDGASTYTVEVTFGEDGPYTVAELPGDVTTYEDFPAPPNTELTYRVSAVTSAGTREVGTARLTTPEEVPNPLAVTVKLEEYTFEFPVPTPDPNQDPNDPSQVYPPGFDPENPDYSLLQPGPKTVYADIGPEGGSLEATGANGVKYTLTVPPGAVEFTIPFGLTPVQSIDGLPLSGGLIGAVRVEPEGIEFDPPLLLDITPPEDAPPPAGDQVVMGFAVTPQSEGNEFYFLPRLGASSASLLPTGGGILASPTEYGPLGNLTIRDGKVIGVARGSRNEVRSTAARNPPSSSSHRTTSSIAARSAQEGFEDLAPYPFNPIEKKAVEAGSTDQFLEVLTDFQAYLDAGGRVHSERTWDEILLNTKVMFEKTKGKCLTRDGYVAAGVAARMSFAHEGTFWSQFRDRYVKKYGNRSLEDARAYARRCKLTLTIDSDMTWKVAGTSIVYNANIQIPLIMSYDSNPQSARYGPYLKGYGLVIPSRVEQTSEDCDYMGLLPEPGEFIRIGIQLVFGGEELAFAQVVDFGGGGLKAVLEQKCTPDQELSRAAIGRGSGGMWGSMFVDARAANAWGLQVASPPPSSGVIATKVFSGPEQGGSFSGATIIEKTTLKLIVGGS